MADRERAKQLICKIVALNGGRVVRMGHLYKAFHAAHLYYWENAQGQLSDYPIVKMDKGPGIDRGKDLVAELVREGRIRTSTELIGPYPATVLEFVGDASSEERNSPESKAILDALEFVRDKDTNELAIATHKRAWNSVTYGAEMDIYLDTLTDEEVEELNDCGSKAKALLSTLLD